MSCFSGPEVVNTSLVLALDAANPKSYQYYPTTSDHGISSWYCFVSGTATYSIITANVSIYQVNQNTVTTVVTGTTNPQRGTISVIAGCTYYGNGPIFLMVEDQQHSIAPISMSGTKFANYNSRNAPGTIFVYAPYTTSVVNFYDATASGINSTATRTFTVKRGETVTIDLPNLGWSYISATTPILCTTTQAGADKKILTPASTHIYNRIPQFNNTIINTTPTTVGSYYVTDTTNLVVSDQIADGSGGDSNQGLGYQHLCDRYSWGNSLSDYQIVAPYSTTVTVSYWNGASWTVWDTHVLSGTQSSPVYVARDGTNGPGVAAANIQGAAAYMASGTTGPWKWEGTNPFYLCINDTADDEFSMLGWLNSKTTQASTDFCLGDTSGTGLTGIPYNGLTYNSSGYIVLDGTDDYFITGQTPVSNSSSSYTVSIWCYRDRNNNNYEELLSQWTAANSGNSFYFGFYNSNVRFTDNWSNVTVSGAGNINVWMNLVGVYSVSNAYIYLNGELAVTKGSGFSYTGTGPLIIGRQGELTSEYFKGRLSNINIYNRALSADEIRQNFNAVRSRFGI